MAKLSTDELLDAFKEMTLIELSEFVKQFEDTFGVTHTSAGSHTDPGGYTEPNEATEASDQGATTEQGEATEAD